MSEKEATQDILEISANLSPELRTAFLEYLEGTQSEAAVLGLSMKRPEALIEYLKMQHVAPIPRELASALLSAFTGSSEDEEGLVLRFVKRSHLPMLEKVAEKERRTAERFFTIRRSFVLSGGLNRNGYDNAIEAAAKQVSVSRTTVSNIMTRSHCDELRQELAQEQEEGLTLKQAYDAIAPSWSEIEKTGLGQNTETVQNKHKRFFEGVLKDVEAMEQAKLQGAKTKETD